MKTQRRLTIATALLAVVALTALIADGSRQTLAKEIPPVTTSVAARSHASGPPPAVYTTTITPADIPPEFPPEAIPILVGDWQIELTEDGQNLVSKDGEVAVFGHYTANRARVVLTDDGGPLACFDSPGIATGVYAWSFQNDELTLSPVLEHCLGRQIVLTAHPLQKQ